MTFLNGTGARVLLVHVFFNELGGAEFLALNAAKALKEEGCSVELLTCTPINAEKLRNMLGLNVEGLFAVRRARIGGALVKLFRRRMSRLKRLMTYHELFTSMLPELKRSYDVVMETQSNLPSPADINYIHYPALLQLRESRRNHGGVHRRVYDKLVEFYAERLSHSFSLGMVLTNSTWTAGQIYRAYGVYADVVYPPVDVEYFGRVSSSDRREKLVVTVSRLSLGKRLERIVDIAARLRDYTFVLAGSSGEESERVLVLIEEKVREYRLDNVVVEPDLPRDKLLKYLGEAMFYLHPEYPEHFGISVVEAMAAGAVPIVYRDGGAWFDVVSRVSELLGYRRIEEASGIIKCLEGDPRLYRELREKSVETSKQFTYERFKKNLLRKIEHVLRVKRIAFSNRRS